jgi:hypothetical protein
VPRSPGPEGTTSGDTSPPEGAKRAPHLLVEQAQRAPSRCHRRVTTLQQRGSMMQLSHRGDMRLIEGISRQCTLPREGPGWRQGGSGKPVELRAPGGMRRAWRPPACHHLVWKRPGQGKRPLEQVSVVSGGCPATIDARGLGQGIGPSQLRPPTTR